MKALWIYCGLCVGISKEATANLRELVEITIKEDLTDEDIQEILSSRTKIFSEFEMVV